MIQTRQRLKCHRIAPAGAELVTFGRVVARYEKRGREYVDIEVAVIVADEPDQPLWTSWVTFTPTATLGVVVTERRVTLRRDRGARARVLAARQLPLRRGDREPRWACPASSRKACRSRARRTTCCSTNGAKTFLAHGEIDLRFVGMVVAGDSIEARVEIDADGWRDDRGREHDCRKDRSGRSRRLQ